MEGADRDQEKNEKKKVSNLNFRHHIQKSLLYIIQHANWCDDMSSRLATQPRRVEKTSVNIASRDKAPAC